MLFIPVIEDVYTSNVEIAERLRFVRERVNGKLVNTNTRDDTKLKCERCGHIFCEIGCKEDYTKLELSSNTFKDMSFDHRNLMSNLVYEIFTGYVKEEYKCCLYIDTNDGSILNGDRITSVCNDTYFYCPDCYTKYDGNYDSQDLVDHIISKHYVLVERKLAELNAKNKSAT